MYCVAADERREEAHAGGVDVVAAGVARAEPVLHQRCRRREEPVRRRGADDDQVDVLGVHAGVFERHARGVSAEAARGLVRRGDVPLDDARAVADPLVGGLDELLEVGVA